MPRNAFIRSDNTLFDGGQGLEQLGTWTDYISPPLLQEMQHQTSQGQFVSADDVWKGTDESLEQGIRSGPGLLAQGLINTGINTASYFAGEEVGGLFGDIAKRLLDDSMGVDPNYESQSPLQSAAYGVGTVIPETAVFSAGELASLGAKYGPDIVRMLAKDNAMAEEVFKRYLPQFESSIAPTAPTGGGSKYVKGVAEGDELVTQHNLTANNLRFSDELGGIPVPSTAVTKVSNPLEGFGEITLLGGQDLATPSGKNPVWFGDAYTKRSPEIFTKYKAKEKKAIDNFYWQHNKDMPKYIKDKNYEISELTDGRFDFNSHKMDENNQFQFLKERGIDVDYGDGGYRDVREGLRGAIEGNNLNGEYSEWVNNLSEHIGVAGEKRIWESREKSKPLNLQNMVKAMKGGAGDEGTSYGLSSVKGATQSPARSISQIKSSRDKIQTEDITTAAREEFDNRYDGLVSKIDEENGFQNSYSQFIDDLVESKGNINQLKQWYKISPELELEIKSFVNDLKESPVGYFEGAPQRGVEISEFQGALVPEDVPSYVKDILDKNNVPYEVYIGEGRKDALQKFNKLFYSGAPAAIGLNSLYGNQDDTAK